MPTALTHAFVAFGGGKACFRRPMPWRFWFLAMACSAGPDLDVGLHRLGIEYEDLWGHRGMTHSVFFAFVLSLVLVSLAFRRDAPVLTRSWWALVAFFFAITASHGLLDAFTDGGLGIAFFAPVSETRYFMPWRPLLVSNFGVGNLFTEYGMRVLLVEIVWVWVPVGAVSACILACRSWLARRHATAQ